MAARADHVTQVGRARSADGAVPMATGGATRAAIRTGTDDASVAEAKAEDMALDSPVSRLHSRSLGTECGMK